jgi:hypothetical protein
MGFDFLDLLMAWERRLPAIVSAASNQRARMIAEEVPMANPPDWGDILNWHHRRRRRRSHPRPSP